MATNALIPQQVFGVHQITFNDLEDESKMGTGKIIDDASPDIVQEIIENRGGSSPFAWAAAPGNATGDIALILKQYDRKILDFLGLNLPDLSNIEENVSGDAAGFTSAIINQKGSSLVDPTTGIASIAVDVATVNDLAFGDYAIRAVSATTIDIFLNTDVSGKAPYIDENLKINATPITIPGTDGTVVSTGIEFTGGSGSIALIIGDVATFSVRPINTYNFTRFIGKIGAAPKEFGITIVSESVNGKLVLTNFPRVISADGTAVKFKTKEFSMIETTLKILQPCNVDYVGKETYLNR